MIDSSACSAWHSRSDYKSPEKGSVMESKILVSEQDIINTYSKEDQFSCQKYFEYKKLIRGNPALGYKKAAKLLGVKQGSTRWWHTEGEKKATPNPLKVVQKLKDFGLIPFTEKHKDSETIFNILGTLFGDGGIDCRFNTVAFISADKRDVDLWHEDLMKIFSFAQGKTQIVEGGEYGHSYNVRCYDRAVVRFFAALGAPVGNKVTTEYFLPKWILGSSESSKVAFLDGYLASEVSIPIYVVGASTMYFNNFSLGVSKIEFLEETHRAFLKSVEFLLDSVGVPTTGNLYKCSSSGTHRKDGTFTANYRIFIKTSYNNVLYFNELFPLCYAQGKKDRLNKTIAEALQHQKERRWGESMP
jgi:Lon-like ATP-dependent protease